MKQGWEIKKLGEVATILNGYAFDSKLFSEDVNDMPLIRIRDIKRGHTETFYKGTFSNDYIIRKGDYLIGMDGEFNIAEWKGNDALLNQRVCKIIANDIVDRYLLWYMPVVLKQIEDATPFVTVKHLSSKQLLNTIIPIPPRAEQERIVAELDCLSGVIERKREQLKQLDTLAQSIFYQMFGDPITNEKGWKVKKWGDLFDTILGKMLDKKKQVETDVVLPYIANTNVQWGYFILDDLKTMTFSDKERIKLKLELGDILICEGGESGRCAVWNGANEEILFQKAIHRARVKNGSTIMPMFVSILLKEIKLNGGLKDYISKSTIEHLTGEKLNLVPIICPPLILQQEFADKIEAIEKQKELIKQSITQAEELFNSRMDYYFN